MLENLVLYKIKCNENHWTPLILAYKIGRIISYRILFNSTIFFAKKINILQRENSMSRDALEKEVANRKKLQMQLEAQINGYAVASSSVIGHHQSHHNYHQSQSNPSSNERLHRSVSPNKVRHKIHVCINVYIENVFLNKD